MKRLSIVTYTSKGREISKNIKAGLSDFSVNIFAYKIDFDDSKTLITKIFDEYDAVLFVAAMGIAVRLIAPHIEDKTKDIPVVVMDSNANYVIPVLSGHLGGANELAQKIACITGAIPVITTATDSLDVFSPDMFAKKNYLGITDMDMAKEIAAKSIEGENIGIYDDKEGYIEKNNEKNQEKCEYKYGIVITDMDKISEDDDKLDMYKNIKTPFEHTLYLIRKPYVLGVGCRKDIDANIFENEVKKILKHNNISTEKIAYMTSIDLKKNEKAICDFAKKHKLDFITYDADKLNKVEGDFEISEYVRSVTGVDNVCERSVMVTCKEIVVHKTKGEKVTVAIGSRW